MQQQEFEVEQWTYHQQVSFCGKERCVKCRQRIGHGPYWYAYKAENGRTIKRYLGKTLPEEAQKQLQEAEKEGHPLVRIHVLGQFRLERYVQGKWMLITKASWQQQRVRRVLACLVAAPERLLTREQVMEQLWPGLELSKASDRLDRAVYELRELLDLVRHPNTTQGSLIRIEQGVIMLASQEQVWLDVQHFELLLEQAWQCRDEAKKEALLGEARILYAGEFLANEDSFPLLQTSRERLTRGWIALLMALADLQSVRQALPEAIEVLYLLIKYDPLNEGAIQRLMRILWQVGQRDKAVMIYKRLVALLRQQYTIAPLPETRSLYESMVRGFTLESPLAPTSQGSVPPLRVMGRFHPCILVGRQSEMEQVRGFLALVEIRSHFKLPGQKKLVPFEQTQAVQCVCLIGEVGIGKTRLAEEVGSEARQQKWNVVWSRAYQLETSIPYRLWTELLRQIIEQMPWIQKRLKSSGKVFQPLTMLLPELQEWITPLGGPSLSGESLRLWEAILELLLLASEQAPLLLVFDDVQWADESSCELLVFLLRRVRGASIFFLATCREHELSHNHTLNKAFTDLHRERSLALLSLTALSKEEIEQLITQIPQLPISYISLITEQADGNPYFAEELARSQMKGKILDMKSLPETIAATLELRLNQLSPICLRVLSKASVLRAPFSFRFLAILETATGGLSEDELLEILEEALSAGMLSEEVVSRVVTYRFWHPLLAQHLYERLSSARRASVHRKIAAVLESNISTMHEKEAFAAQILSHLELGGASLELIALYAELAGNYAYRMAAYGEAMQYYSVAVAQEGTAQQQDMFLWERYSEAARIHGAQDRALVAWKRVLELHAPFIQQEPEIHAALLTAYAQIYYDIGDEQAMHLLEEAEVHLQKLQARGAVWGLLRWQQSCVVWMHGNFEQAEQYAQRALVIFEQCVGDRSQSPEEPTSLRRTLAGDPVDIGRVLRLLSTLAVSRPTPAPQQALAFAQRALGIFERCQKRREIVGIQCDIANIYLTLADYEKAKAFLEESLAKASLLGDRPIMAVNIVNLGIIASFQQCEEEARGYFEQGIQLAEETQDWHYIPFFSAYYVLVLLQQQREEEARKYLCKALCAERKVVGSIYGNAAQVALAAWLLYRAALRPGASRMHLLQSAQVILARSKPKLDSDFTIAASFLQVDIYWLSLEPKKAQEKLQQLLFDVESSGVVWAQHKVKQIAVKLGLCLIA